MVEQEQQFVTAGLPHSHTLSAAASLADVSQTCSATVGSPYPELASYSVVPSFALPSHCDSSILTPISSAASPPLNQGDKSMGQYPPPPETPLMQQPSPPASSRMYPHWNNNFDMDTQSSEANSPMGAHGQVAQGFYMHEGRRSPGRPEPYMGMFGVSNGPDAHGLGPPNGQSYYLGMGGPIENPHHPSLPVASQPREAQLPSGLLDQPYPPQYRQHRADSHEDGIVSNSAALQHNGSSLSSSPRRRSITQGNTRVKKSKSKRQPSKYETSFYDPTEDHTNCRGDEVAPTLIMECPDEERCIFDSRWRHRHQRGQDMWESIQNDFEKQFNKTHGKEMLQMKFKRGRSKYIQWLPEDEAFLRQAWLEVERKRYDMILESFLELGGSRNMLLSPTDIEVKVVNDLRLEDGLYLDNSHDIEIRRRRRIVSKKRPSVANDDIAAAEKPVPMSKENPELAAKVLRQAQSRQSAKCEDNASANGELVDVPMWNNQPAIKAEPQQDSEYVLRSASRKNGHRASRSAASRGKAA